MKDEKLITRASEYRKCSFGLLQERENQQLTLRKQQLSNFINNKRMKLNTVLNATSLQIDPVCLEVGGLAHIMEKAVKFLFNFLGNRHCSYLGTSILWRYQTSKTRDPLAPSLCLQG